jgi:putative MATE family efflux protein
VARNTPGNTDRAGDGERSQPQDLTNASREEILNVDIRSSGRGGNRQGTEGTSETGGGGGRRSAYATRDLTQGSIPKNLWFLAWPQMIEGALNMVDRVADLFWAGRYFGVHAIGGLTIAQLYTNFIMTARTGLDTGMRAMIARSIGAGRVDLANHVALQSFSITAVFALAMAITGVFLTDFLLQIMGVSEDVIDIAGLYMRIQFIGFAGQAFRQMTGGALQAAGDSMTPMKATTISRVAHLVSAPVLIFGWLGFPQLDLAGAALANVVAQGLGVAWNSYALFAGTSRLHLTLRGYYVDFPLLARLVRIGAPASVTGLERSMVHLLLARLVTPFGTSALAAYGITRNLEQFTALGSMGLGRASGTLVGQNLGANNPERAKRTVRWALGYVTAIRGSMALMLMAFPALFVAIFSSDPALMEVAVVWVRIQAVTGLVMGGSMVFSQSFNVAGDTMAPMIITMIAMVGVELPLAFALSQWTPMGQYGIPLAITIAMILRIAIYFPYFLKGRWLRIKVID